MELNLLKISDQELSVDKVPVNESVFSCPFKETLVHQVVTAYQAKARSGSKAQKTRAEVRGGGIKPWRQKGTGRARAGSSRSPIWRKGGVTFAAKPRSFAQKVNQKMYKGAMRSILSELVREERLLVVDEFVIALPKTGVLVKKLDGMGLKDVLIITDDVDENLYLASRNLYKVAVCDVAGINPVALIGFEKIMVTVPALQHLERALA